MARIRSKNTKPERVVRQIAFSLGYRYRLHSPEPPGSPDLVFKGRRKVIFVHGCFWHAHCCRIAHSPKTRTAYWNDKFARNKARDARVQRAFAELRLHSLTIWECEVTNRDEVVISLQSFLGTCFVRADAHPAGPQARHA